MTNDEQYVPSDGDMRWQYVVKRMLDGATRTHAEQEYTRWLAAHDTRVRRDAEDELDSWMARAYEAEQRAWQAEARIKAVRDVLGKHEAILGDNLGVPVERIRRALDGA